MTAPADRRLLVFARAPRAGRVKTRLGPALGLAGAAILYRHLLVATMAQAARVPSASAELWCDSEGDDHGECGRLASRFGMALRKQQGTGLGARMHHALGEALKTASHAVLIGTDCPELDADYLADAITALAEHDAVLGPVADGGYVLIGLKRADHRLFYDIPWSTDRVLDLTRSRLTALGWRWAELPTLRDLDRPSDLAYFPQLAARIRHQTRNPQG